MAIAQIVNPPPSQFFLPKKKVLREKQSHNMLQIMTCMSDLTPTLCNIYKL
jgi:hypothetical protein